MLAFFISISVLLTILALMILNAYCSRNLLSRFGLRPIFTASIITKRGDKSIKFRLSVPHGYPAIGCLLSTRLRSPMLLQITHLGSKNYIRSYMPAHAQLKIGNRQYRMYSNEESLLKWIQSGVINSQLDLVLNSPGTMPSTEFRIDRIGLVVGSFTFPKGEYASLGEL